MHLYRSKQPNHQFACDIPYARCNVAHVTACLLKYNYKTTTAYNPKTPLHGFLLAWKAGTQTKPPPKIAPQNIR